MSGVLDKVSGNRIRELRESLSNVDVISFAILNLIAILYALSYHSTAKAPIDDLSNWNANVW